MSFVLVVAVAVALQHGRTQGVKLAFLALFLAAGVESLRMQQRARAFLIGASAFSVLSSAGLLGLRAQPTVSVLLTAALAGWAIWYVCAGGGARVLAPSYAEILASHPVPRPRIALWAKIIAGLLSLFELVSLALDLLHPSGR